MKTQNTTEVTATVETITPKIAKQWLANNTDEQRKVVDYHLENYTSEMKNGQFVLNGDPIRFDWNGKMIDGQHRLMAVIASGKEYKSVVVRGLAPQVFKSVDIGRNRTAGDVLHIEGIQNASKIAAITKFIILFKNGFYAAAANKSGTRSKGARITPTVISKFVAEHRDSLMQSYPMGYNKYNKKMLTGTTLAAFHYLFKQKAQQQADDFCSRLADGENLKKEDIIYKLRTKLHNDSISKKKMPNTDKLALVIKAWNIYRGQAKNVQQLTFNSTQEKFPKIM